MSNDQPQSINSSHVHVFHADCILSRLYFAVKQSKLKVSKQNVIITRYMCNILIENPTICSVVHTLALHHGDLAHNISNGGSTQYEVFEIHYHILLFTHYSRIHCNSCSYIFNCYQFLKSVNKVNSMLSTCECKQPVPINDKTSQTY